MEGSEHQAAGRHGREDRGTEDITSSSGGRISNRFSCNSTSSIHSNTRSSSSGSGMEELGAGMANSSGSQSGTGPASLVVIEAISAGKKVSAHKAALRLQTATTHFVPQGESEHVFARQTASAIQVPMPDINVQTCDDAAGNHVTGDPEHVLNRQVPPRGQHFVMRSVMAQKRGSLL